MCNSKTKNKNKIPIFIFNHRSLVLNTNVIGTICKWLKPSFVIFSYNIYCRFWSYLEYFRSNNCILSSINLLIVMKSVMKNRIHLCCRQWVTTSREGSEDFREHKYIILITHGRMSLIMKLSNYEIIGLIKLLKYSI